MTDRYAVIGNPIAHSRSPQIHASFAAQTGDDIQYDRILAATDDFADTVASFRKDGGKGLNVTVPFKGDAYDFADQLSPRATIARAVNTLVFSDGKILGDNTDGVGLVRDLTDNLNVTLAGKRILMLGAGGAARGVAMPIAEQQPAEFWIANRTLSRALDLAEALADVVQTTGVSFEELSGQAFDIVINATSASLSGDLPPLPEALFAPGAMAYDMMYGAEPTVFMRWAERVGASRCADGLGMLVEQAAESFSIWRGNAPETRPVIAKLRASLQPG